MLLMAIAAAIGLFYLAFMFMESLAPDTRIFVDNLSFFVIAFLIVISACFMSRRKPERHGGHYVVQLGRLGTLAPDAGLVAVK